SGPTYRAGVLREVALARMEDLEREHGVESVAFEMLGPPRLTKLLFEASILERLYGDLEAAAELDEEGAARASLELVEGDDLLRTDILAAGMPVLRPDGLLLRGATVNIGPAEAPIDVDRLAHQGWVDLRPASWVTWRDRCRALLAHRADASRVDAGSRHDVDLRAVSSRIRPGVLVSMVLRVEERGERIKR
ncbi:MAG: hypothetical protein R3266_08915, partial [Gemmatimonadota bacterium]|nr:hypothetical protein [Gemmatimonadota bacterium]